MKLYSAMPRNLESRVIFLILTFCLTAFGATADVDTGFDPELTIDLETYFGHTVLQPDGKILAFGSYRPTQQTPERPYINRLNPDGSVDTSFDCPECRSITVRSIAFQPDGKIFIGGSGKIIRVNSDGSLDASFSSPFDTTDFPCDPKFMEVQPDGKLLIVCVNQQFFSQETVRRLNADGSFDSSFTAVALEVSPHYVVNQMILLASGKFVIGGDYSDDNGGWMTRFDADGSIDSSFQFSAAVKVESFDLLDDGKLIAMSNSLGRIIKLSEDGSVDNSFSATIASDESPLEVRVLSNGQFYVRLFKDPFPAPGDRVYRFVRYNADGTVDKTFSQTFLGPGDFIIDNSDRIITFKLPGFQRLNFDGSVDSSFVPVLSVDGIAKTAALQSDGKIVIAGEFEKSNGVASARITRINSDGTNDATFNSGTGFDVQPKKVAVQPDGKILVSGPFTEYDGTPRTHIARLNADGTLDSSFSLSLTSEAFSPEINAIHPLSDGKILIGGFFDSVNGTEIDAIVRLNADGSLDTSFDSPFDGPAFIHSILEQSDGKILLGSHGSLVRLNTDGSFDKSFSSSISDVSDIIQRADGKYIVSIDSVDIYFETVLLLHSNGERDFSYQPPHMTQGSSRINKILEQPNGNIVFAGSFSTVNGRQNSNIARIGPIGQTDIYFPEFGTNGVVNTILAQPDGKIIFVGDFTGIEDVGRSGVARLTLSNRTSGTLFDFDGDGRSDISVFRPSTNVWYHLLSGSSSVSIHDLGASGDIPAPADYDGDGITDIGVFRPSIGDWLSILSSDNTLSQLHWGQDGDIPLPSDANGDGKDDLVAYRPSTGIWYRSAGGFINFGAPEDKPLIGDFDGDGKKDMAIFRPSTGNWWYAASSASFEHRSVQWGVSDDIPVPADYDGDGSTDYAVYRPSNGSWYIANSSGGFTILPFGVEEDKPVAADYDGDGKADIAVFRPSTGTWYLLQSTAGFSALNWGISTDIPSENAFIP